MIGNLHLALLEKLESFRSCRKEDDDGKKSDCLLKDFGACAV